MRRSSITRTTTGVLGLSFAIQVFIITYSITRADSFLPTVVPRSRSNGLTSTATVQEAVWKFNGHDIYTNVKTPSDSSSYQSNAAVLLIHGFGCSTTYWRETAAALVDEGYEVHSVDLLGQGKSAKPGRADGIEYSIALWAHLVESYARENIRQDDVVLVGNSLGSLVALTAATGDFGADGDDSWLKKRVKGICMFNCGVGLNSRGIAREPRLTPTQRLLINSLYNVLTFFIFENRWLLAYVLDEVVTKDLLRNTLQSLYKYNPDQVDDELVDSFYIPAKDEGSVEALSQIYSNDPGKTPFELHEKYNNFLSDLPIQLVWGDEDIVTPIVGGVGQFYLGLGADKDSKVSFQLVKGGHVPFDDNPIESNRIMLQWLDGI